MLWRWSLRILALSVVLVVAQRRFSPSEIKAEFYADLGPNEYSAPKNSDSFLRWKMGPKKRKIIRWGFNEDTTQPSSKLG